MACLNRPDPRWYVDGDEHLVRLFADVKQAVFTLRRDDLERLRLIAKFTDPADLFALDLFLAWRPFQAALTCARAKLDAVRAAGASVAANGVAVAIDALEHELHEAEREARGLLFGCEVAP